MKNEKVWWLCQFDDPVPISASSKGKSLADPDGAEGWAKVCCLFGTTVKAGQQDRLAHIQQDVQESLVWPHLFSPGNVPPSLEAFSGARPADVFQNSPPSSPLWQ